MKVKRTKKWHKKVTIKELRHILESTTTGTLAQFKRNLDHQRAGGTWPDSPSNSCIMTRPPTGSYGTMSCWECHFIAKKLGI